MDCNKFGWNILMMGCSNKDIDLVKFALANKLDVNSKDLVGHTPLSFCAANQSTEIAQLIIKSGAYVNEQDSQGRSILALAAQEGNLELVVLLLQCNADPRIPDCENKLPSDYAKMAPEDFVNKETYKKIEDLLNNAVKSYETKK
jgi:ankyrin repeat protein